MTGTGMSCTTLGKSDIDIVEVIARRESPGTFYTPYKGQKKCQQYWNLDIQVGITLNHMSRQETK